MGLTPPSRVELAEYAVRAGFRLSGEQIAQEELSVAELLALFGELDEVDQPHPAHELPSRDMGRPPKPGEDPYNAVIRFCHVRDVDDGPFAGRRIAVKDTIAVAGVPMTGGRRDRSVVPVEDAVVIERLLAAGGTICSKTNLNAPFDFGATRHPHDPRFWAGGSSSGSAVVVATGSADAAIGVDTGGSIRIPSAWCGLVGMKATHGLVPAYGTLYWDHTLDHVGPMTTTVADNALMLEIIAGSDPRDPQWTRTEATAGSYGEAAGQDVTGLRVGVIADACETAGSTPLVLEAFRRAVARLEVLGAEVVTVPVPLWRDAVPIWLAEIAVGLTAMDSSLGQGDGHLGQIDVDLLAASGPSHLAPDRELPFGGRTLPLAVEHLRRAYHGVPLARAHNLRLSLRRQLDAALNDVDLLLTPTTPTGPPPVPADADSHRRWVVTRENCITLANTCPANLTGHPALTLPIGAADNQLPTGLQIIGRKFDETTVYRLAFALESPR